MINTVIDKLYDKCQNPPPIKINKQEAFELGKSVCPVVIEIYVEGIKNLFDNLPYISGRYMIDAVKLKNDISANKAFCNNISIRIGSQLIEQMGDNSSAHATLSLASMTVNSIKPVKKEEIPEEETSE